MRQRNFSRYLIKILCSKQDARIRLIIIECHRFLCQNQENFLIQVENMLTLKNTWCQFYIKFFSWKKEKKKELPPENLSAFTALGLHAVQRTLYLFCTHKPCWPHGMRCDLVTRGAHLSPSLSRWCSVLLLVLRVNHQLLHGPVLHRRTWYREMAKWAARCGWTRRAVYRSRHETLTSWTMSDRPVLAR